MQLIAEIVSCADLVHAGLVFMRLFAQDDVKTSECEASMEEFDLAISDLALNVILVDVLLLFLLPPFEVGITQRVNRLDLFGHKFDQMISDLLWIVVL